MRNNYFNFIAEMIIRRDKIGRFARICLMLSLAAPIMIIGVFSYTRAYNEMTKLVISQKQDIAQLSALMLHERLDKAVEVGLSLASRKYVIEFITEGKWPDASRLLQDTSLYLPWVTSYFIADKQGVVKYGSPASVMDVADQSFAWRDWYKGVSSKWEPYVSEVYKRAYEPYYNVVAVTLPIKKGDVVIGILVLQIKIDTFSEWLKSYDFGKSGYAYIADKNANVIYHPQVLRQGKIVRYSKNDVIYKALKGENGAQLYADKEHRQDHVTAYEYIPKYDWAIAVTQPAKEAFALRNIALSILMAIFIFLLAVDLFLGYMILQASASYIRSDTTLKELNISLERQVKDRTAQLEYAYRNMEDEIVAHKRVEQSLLESEERLSVLFHAMSDGVLAADQDTMIINFANNAAVMMFGYSLDELVDMKITQLHPAEDADSNIEKFKNITSNAFHVIPGIRVKRKDGTIIYVDINPFIITLSGKMYKCGIFRDVTSRLQAEQEIQRLNRTYSLISKVSQLMVNAHDKDELLRQLCHITVDQGKFSMCWVGLIDKQTQLISLVALKSFDSGNLDYLNASKIDLLSGNNIFSKLSVNNKVYIINDISSDEDFKPWRKESLAAGYKSCAVYALFLKKAIIGFVSFYSDEANFFTPKEVQLLSELCEDISFSIDYIDAQATRDLAERDLENYKVHLEELIEDRTRQIRASENKYRVLLENLPQKIFLKDRNSVYISCNNNYAKDLKITPGEITGKKDYDFFQKELADKYIDDDKRIMSASKPEEFDEKYNLNGADLIVHTIKSPIADEHGDVYGIFGIFWDVTERRRAEDELIKKMEELELFHRVAVRREIKMVELKLKVEELEEQLRELQDKNKL